MIIVDSFLTYTIAMLVFFVGVLVNKRYQALRNFNIPEPVSGGLIAASCIYLLYLLFDIELQFELDTRDRLLVYFFTAIGLNARLSDIKEGGTQLTKLLLLTIIFIVLQSAIGFTGVQILDLPDAASVLLGSASLIGGHGTAIAWAPNIEALGVEKAMEIGIASATLGLVIASILGGPIAKHLISKYHLQSVSDDGPIVGLKFDEEPTQKITALDVMVVFFTIHVAIIVAYVIHLAITKAGIQLPLFVVCLFVGIIMSNTIPTMFKKLPWPARTQALALVSDYSLGLFLTMSLLGIQLWSVASLAGSLVLVLAAQTLLAYLFIVYILFPMLGITYESAVLSAGFAGFSLGATPTAIANMSAVTRAHGPAPNAFILLPLVAAFFVDIVNAVVIQLTLYGTI